MPANATDPVILIAGEALFDLVLDDSAELAAHPGGGPFNAARTIGRLEQPAAYLGRLSRDRFGSRLRTLLADDGVRLDTVVDTDDPTTLALAELDAQGTATYRFYSRGTSAPGLTPQAALDALPGAVDMLHIGTLGLALEPVATALEAVTERLAGDALVMLDPNCRPGVVEDEEAYRARLWRVLAHTDVVKVSDDDLAWLDPGTPPVDAARALLEPGAAAALLTRGAEGAIVITATDAVSVPAPRVEVVDTIGAGDAFGGGFLASWRREGRSRERLANLDAVVAATEFACLVAARTCERRGASPPRLNEL
ncbi:MAG: fructokinase [Solirubrobacteraceae bacterium]|jgi:fructokinase|nr:fructokinase [Solirubrobacteraceae bacterium]